MKSLFFIFGIVFSTTVALHNSAQAEPQFIFSDDVAQGVRKNISIGVQAGEDFFKTRLGITFSKSFSVVASNTDSFRKRNVPAKFYDSNCNGGYANPRFFVICAESESFNRNQFAGGLDVQQRVISLHEYVHVLQFEFTKISAEPAWFQEGFAEHVVLLYKEKLGITNKKQELAWQRGLARTLKYSLEQLEGRDRFNKSDKSVSAGMIAIADLEGRSGFQAFSTYYRLRGKGVSWKKAFEQAFGVTTKEFYAGLQL